MQTLHGPSWWGVGAERDVPRKQVAVAEVVMNEATKLQEVPTVKSIREQTRQHYGAS